MPPCQCLQGQLGLQAGSGTGRLWSAWNLSKASQKCVPSHTGKSLPGVLTGVCTPAPCPPVSLQIWQRWFQELVWASHSFCADNFWWQTPSEAEKVRGQERCPETLWKEGGADGVELGIWLMSLCRVRIDSDPSEVRDWVSEIFPFMLFLIFLYCVICILKTTELSNSWDYLLVFPHRVKPTCPELIALCVIFQ